MAANKGAPHQNSQAKGGGDNSFPVVAIGSSAGGLEALESFFDHMPSDSGMTFIVIQHLDPQGKSMLGDILSRHTGMKIHEAKEGTKVEPDHIYLAPAGNDVAIRGGVLHLTEPLQLRGTKLSIDFFFRSLSEDRREKAICIILSGTGSDGTLGLRAIKKVGGMAMVQDENQAKFDGMPRSAIATGLVDYILPVEKMPQELISYAAHPWLRMTQQDSTEEKKSSSIIQDILVLLRSKTGRDFIHYKRKTIRRRIERRMALHRIRGIADYFRFLQDNLREINLLSMEFLIGVTNFFRDPDAFGSLKEKAVNDILKRKRDGAQVRVWVPGCATGEEALSLAMLFSEAMDEMKKQNVIQIFATDIDQQAIERARAAEYPVNIAADVSEERLRRFFVKEEDKYKAKSEIREMVVYATQDINTDPPFSKLDLISCRNLLIYFDAVLQKKIMPLFHYTLNPGGYLFLGSSETTGGFADLFAPVDVKWKVYKAKKASIPKAFTGPAPAETRPADPVGRGAIKAGGFSTTEVLDRMILDEYAPAGVIFDQKYNIVYFRGPTLKYLELPEGEATFNLMKIARDGLRHKLPAALQKVIRERVTLRLENVQIRDQGVLINLDVIVRPISESADLFTMIFLDGANPTPARRKKRTDPIEAHPRLIELEQELQATKESLQTIVEEMDASNEELRSANEELQSTNEEMQSTNEEVETAKEELQSTNEELMTLNSELQSKVDELGELNSDVDNLLASTDVGTIFLDGVLRIRRFTPSMTRLFNLIPADEGRSIKDITSKIDYSIVYQGAEEVLDTLQIKRTELRAEDGRWYSMRILPYRTRANIIDGVVITFVDITDRKLIEQRLLAVNAYSEAIIDTIREAILVIDADLRVRSANKSFYRLFKATPEETEGELIYELGSGEWDVPRFRELLETVLAKGSSFEDFEIEHHFPSLGLKKLLINARQIHPGEDKEGLVLVAIEDIANH